MKKVSKGTYSALFFETLAVNTTAAEREDLFSTKLFKVKCILLWGILLLYSLEFVT